jgi:hypothetical protein
MPQCVAGEPRSYAKFLKAVFVAATIATTCMARVAHAAPQAFQLNNVSDVQSGWASISDNATLHLQRFTAEMWIKPLGPGYGHTEDEAGAAIFAKPDQGGVGGGPLSYHMGWCPTTEKLNFLLTNTPPNVYVDFSSTAIAPLNTWTHVAFAFDGSLMRIMVNGVADAQAAYPYASVYYGSEPILIGAGNYLTPYLRRFQGQIDDVRLWNYARTPAQVAAQMNCALAGSEAGLVANWKLDGNLTDATPNASNGILIGNATWVGSSQATAPCAATDAPRPAAATLMTLSSTPNPARARVALSFALPRDGVVSLAVFDATGREVAKVLDHVALSAGVHSAALQTGSLRAGLYFARLQAGTDAVTRRLMLVK